MDERTWPWDGKENMGVMLFLSFWGTFFFLQREMFSFDDNSIRFFFSSLQVIGHFSGDRNSDTRFPKKVKNSIFKVRMRYFSPVRSEKRARPWFRGRFIVKNWKSNSSQSPDRSRQKPLLFRSLFSTEFFKAKIHLLYTNIDRCSIKFRCATYSAATDLTIETRDHDIIKRPKIS